MPLIDLTHRPGLKLTTEDGGEHSGIISLELLKRIGAQLPGLFAQNANCYGLSERTAEDAVQVMFHQYGEHDVNTADLWIKVQFSESPPALKERKRIRDAVFNDLVRTFEELGLDAPESFVIDLLWGPTHGKGRIKGSQIVW